MPPPGPWAGHDAPVAHRLVDRVTAHPTECLVRDGQDRAVGGELAHRLGERRLELCDPALLGFYDRLQRRPWQRLLHRETLGRGEDPDHDRGSRLERSTDLVLHRTGELVAGEAPDDGARRGPDSDGCEHRGREQTDQHPDAAAPAGAAVTEVVPGVHQSWAAVGVLADQDHPVAVQILGLHLPGKRAELLLGDVDIGVTGDHEDPGLTHVLLPSTRRGRPPTGRSQRAQRSAGRPTP